MKPPLSHLPLFALGDVAKVFKFGADKYAPGDWAMPNNGGGDHVDAALRHISEHLKAKHYGGKLNDEESGLPHIDHAIARLMMAKGKAVLGDGLKPEVDMAKVVIEILDDDAEVYGTSWVWV